MSLSKDELDVMRQVLEGKIERDDIVKQPTHRLRASAMVGYILLHRDRYLDGRNRLQISYQHIASLLMKGRFHADMLVITSLEMGLHRSQSPLETGVSMSGMRRIITIMPPSELKDLLP